MQVKDPTFSTKMVGFFKEHWALNQYTSECHLQKWQYHQEHMGMGRNCTDILEAVGQISRIQSHAVLAFPSLVRAGWEHASHPDVNVVPIPRQPGMVQSYFKRASWIEEPRPGSQSVQCTWSRGLQPQQSQCTALLLLVLAMLEIDGFHDYPSQLWVCITYHIMQTTLEL